MGKLKVRAKKLRGDAARAKRLGKVAREAAASALSGDARNRTQRKMIATLVELLGGDVVLPFRLVAGAAELETEVENPNTADAAMHLRVGRRRPGGAVILRDRVIVHSWSRTLGATEPELTGLSWPGKVVQLDGGDLVVVELDEVSGPGAPPVSRVIVPMTWVRYDASTRVDDLPALYPASAAEPPDEEDDEKPDPCEGCGRPSTGSDPEGVPLCDECGGPRRPRGEADPSG